MYATGSNPRDGKQVVREVQIALLGEDASIGGQMDAFRLSLPALLDRWASVRSNPPFRLDPLPVGIGLENASRLPLALGQSSSGLRATIAVGGDTLSQFVFAPDVAPGLLILGDRTRGKSSTAALVASQLHAQGLALGVIAPKTGPVSELGKRLGLKMFQGTEPSAAELDVWLRRAERVGLVVDDAELETSNLLNPVVREAFHRRTDKIVLVVAGGFEAIQLFEGPAREARRSHYALVLSPSGSLIAQEIAGPVPRELIGKFGPGRGVLSVEQGWLPIQVPKL